MSSTTTSSGMIPAHFTPGVRYHNRTLWMTSRSTLTESVDATPGTGNGPITLFREFYYDEHLQYEAMTCHEDYCAFSPEEHRLADYHQGRTSPFADGGGWPSVALPVSFWNRSAGNDREKLDMCVLIILKVTYG
jgi:hypothetical protein